MTNNYWIKTCQCNSTSSTHRIRVARVPPEEHGIPNACVERCVYYPQPSCDACGAPWVKGVEA